MLVAWLASPKNPAAVNSVQGLTPTEDKEWSPF